VARVSGLLRSSRTHLFVVLVLLLMAFGFDLITPRGFTDWVFYLLAVLLTMRIPESRPLFLVAGLASVFTVAGLILSPPGQPVWMSVFSRSLALILIWTTVLIAMRWRRADERLRRLEKAVDGSGEIVFMTDREGIITFVNPAFAEIYGYTAEEVVGKVTPRILKSGLAAPEGYKVFWDTILEKRTAQWEIANKTKDGRLLTIEASASAIVDERDKITGFLAIQRDVTQRRRGEEELKRLNRALRTISECNQALVRAADEPGLLNTICQILVDHGGFRLAWVGYAEQDEAKSVRVVAFAGHEEGYLATLQLTWADQERGRGPTGTAIRTGRESIARKLEADAAFGPWREEAARRAYASSSAFPLIVGGQTLGALSLYSSDPDAFDSEEVDLLRELADDVAYGIGALRNRDERERAERVLKKTQEQFLQAQKMEAVGRLAGGVAHDFNNLLTIINGYGDLLLGRAREGSIERSQLEEIRKAGDRAAALTRQLLAFSRKQVVMPTVLDLNLTVEGMERMLERLIGEDVEFVENLSESLGRVRADAGQIEQVIMNLAVNARDAMPKGGKLAIETANVELDETYARSHAYVTPGKYVMLAISDTGCGMDAETQSHIFEPFFTTKGQGKGTGLGLSTAYGIVKQSGGHIAVYSEVGRGTTFKIYLKRVDEPVAETAKEEVAVSVSGTETILLVEDEPGVRALAEITLRGNGYKLLVAGEYIEALALARQHAGSIHLLLTDVIMPGLNGRELADLLHALRPQMRVLFISGYTADAIAQHGILDEDVAFLPKPFTPRDLLRKVRETLDGARG
jgi:PAS domain S-box-containing protein